jgi:putative peptidoglycan lipid II flippase
MNLLLNWIFTFRLGWGHRGLAFSTSIVATTNFLLLYALMWRHIGRLETRQLLGSLGRIGLAGALLALVCWSANHWWLNHWSDMRFVRKLIGLVTVIAAGATIFFTAAIVLRVGEVQEVVSLVRRKVAR